MYSMSDVQCEMIFVTPKMAKDMLERFKYPRQRNVSDRHVGRLMVEIEKERFIPGTQIHLCHLRYSDLIWCVNGNHTLTAVSEGKTAVPLDFLHTHCENENEVARIYARHDIHRTRTWHAAFQALGLDEKMGLKPRQTDAFGSAMKYIMSDFKAIQAKDYETNYSRDARFDASEDYYEAGQMYFEAVGPLGSKASDKLKRAPVVAVGLKTFRYEPVRAHKFWRAIAEDSGLFSGQPERTLVRWLEKHPVHKSGYRQQINACALCWNAYHKKKPLDVVRAQQFSNFYLAGCKSREQELCET